MRIRTLLVLLTLCGQWSPGVGQVRVTMRFHTGVGVMIKRLFQSYTRITVTPADSGRLRLREIVRLGGAVQLGVMQRRGVGVVHLTYDSLRVRTREDGASWREFAVPGLDSVWLQVTLDQRMQEQRRVAGRKSIGTTLLEQLATGVPGLTVPDGPVGRGDRWSRDLDLTASDAAGDVGAVRFPVRAIFTVDSVVARPRDTLAFIGVQGSLLGGRAAVPDGAVRNLRGELHGAVVWSTGGGGIVSAATRLAATADLIGAGGRSKGWLGIERTLRHSVVQ